MEGDPRDLSTKRAKQVMEFLNKNGIEKNRLSFEGLGTTKPINPLPEKNEAERAENRRVEIMIVEN
jgi:flagellar motor protein MotB